MFRFRVGILVGVGVSFGWVCYILRS